MPLEFLVPLIVGGLAVVALLQWRLGWGAELELDEGQVRRRVALDAPDAAIEELVVADDGRGALVRTPGGVLALGVAGDRHWTRKVKTFRETDGALELSFPDSGAPRLRIPIEDRETRTRWSELLGA